MINRIRYYLNEKDDNFEIKIQSATLLRKLFLSMTYENFVNVNTLREQLPPKVKAKIIRIYDYLYYGMDSYRFFMFYLKDAKTAQLYDKDQSFGIHTDMWGRIALSNAKDALGYAMGFKCFSDKVDVEKYGYERDAGYAEETMLIDGCNYTVKGLKNVQGNFHGFGNIIHDDGTIQCCFFDDGNILARKVYYPNGLSEDIFDQSDIVIDRFAPRYVYELCNPENQNDDYKIVFNDEKSVIEKRMVGRDVVEKLYYTLGQYVFKMEYRHFVQYPYSEGEWEVDKAKCTPSMKMALLYKNELIGILFKTHGTTLVDIGTCEYPYNSAEMYCVFLNEEKTNGEYTFILKTKDEEDKS